jgi:hypothetical protein
MAPVIEAGGLVVTDDRGVIRARIGFVSEDQGFVGLTLYGRDGRSRICISTAEGGSLDRATLLVNDPEGRRRAVLNVERDGAGLRLFDKSEKACVALNCTEAGGTRLALLDPDGKVLLVVPELGSDPTEAVDTAGTSTG